MNKDTFKFPIRQLIKTKMNSGAILLFVALAAMIIANTPFREHYNNFFSKEMVLNIGEIGIFLRHDGTNMTFLDFINDALMVIFFFSVGLEIKREVLVGELSSMKKALLPVVAACGGMIVPVAIFCLNSGSANEMQGAAIPMATDIAFSLGVLALLGKKVPLSLKIFLTTFAVVDDIGGILVIAIFYTSHISFHYLLLALFLIAVLYLGGRMGIYSKLFYIFFGILVWFFFLHSGIHPTIAGVIVAFTVPAKPRLNLYKYVDNIRENLQRLPAAPERENNKIILSNSELSILKSIEAASDKVISPLQSMDDSLSSLVNYVVMPLFAFANASITFDGFTLASLQGVSLNVFLALVLGKLIGIFAFTYITVKTGLLSLPERMNTQSLWGVSMLGGIGFTVSLFIANLSYTGIPEVGSVLLNQAKIGIIGGSIFAGICGYIILNYVLKKQTNNF